MTPLAALRRLVTAWWFRLLISAALITWLARQLDWANAWAAARDTPPSALLVMLAIFLAAQCLGALRWRLMLSGLGVTLGAWEAVKLNFLGLFTSGFLPGSVGGDALKAALVVRQRGHVTEVIGSLFLDRAANTSVVTLVFLLFFNRLSLSLEPVRAQATAVRIGLIAAAGLAVVLLGIVALRAYSRRVEPEASSLSRILARLKDGLRRLTVMRHRPGLLAAALLLSALMLGLTALGAWVLLRGLAAPLPYLDVLAVFASLHFIMILPVTFNGLGLSEVGLVVMLGMLGVDGAAAGAFAVILRAIVYTGSLPGIWYYLPRGGASAGAAERGARS